MRIAPMSCPPTAYFCRSAAALVLFVALLLPGVAARAFEQCPEPQFGIKAIEIDRVESTAEEAQTLGIRQAAQVGFQRVLLRLLRDSAAVSSFMDTHEPDQFVDFFHISEENSLEGRYIAVLDYCFEASRLRSALRSAGLKWAELISQRILVLPVWLGPDGARAWQADNEWLAGWREAVSGADGLVDFTLLEPTILNERSLRAEDIVAADPATLRRAATVSGAEQIMLVTARLDYAGSQPVLAVDGTLFTSSAEPVTVLAKMVDRPVYENLTIQLDYARMHILSELETGWHSANIIEGGETRELTVEMPVASLQDWVARLEALDAIAVVDSYIIRQLGITGGLVTINLVGTDAAVSNALAAHNLRLRQRDDGVTVIEPL